LVEEEEEEEVHPNRDKEVSLFSATSGDPLIFSGVAKASLRRIGDMKLRSLSTGEEEAGVEVCCCDTRKAGPGVSERKECREWEEREVEVASCVGVQQKSLWSEEGGRGDPDERAESYGSVSPSTQSPLASLIGVGGIS